MRFVCWWACCWITRAQFYLLHRILLTLFSTRHCSNFLRWHRSAAFSTSIFCLRVSLSLTCLGSQTLRNAGVDCACSSYSVAAAIKWNKFKSESIFFYIPPIVEFLYCPRGAQTVFREPLCGRKYCVTSGIALLTCRTPLLDSKRVKKIASTL